MATWTRDRRPVLVDLLLSMATCDGELNDAERAQIRTILNAYVDVGLAERAFRPSGFDLERALAIFADDAHSVRASLMTLFAAVARSDGDPNELEQSYLLEAARWLGLASMHTSFYVARPPTLGYPELVELLRVARVSRVPRETSDVHRILRGSLPRLDREHVA